MGWFPLTGVDVPFRVFETPLVRPANDDFADAQALTGSSGSVSGNTLGASRESDEPSHNAELLPSGWPPEVGIDSVWYAWTPAHSATASFTADNAVLVAYTGDSLGALARVPDADPLPEHAQFEVVGGTTYYIAACAPVVDQGPMVLDWILDNDAPTAGDDALDLVGAGPLAIPISSLLANDNDSNSDPLSFDGALPITAGAAVASDGSNVYFTPAPGLYGEQSFRYMISDGWGGSAAAIVRINVRTGDSVTITSASATPNPAIVGQRVSFAATAKDTSGHSISYKWYEGTTLLNSSRTWSTTALSVGTHDITCQATCSRSAVARTTFTVVVNPVPKPLAPTLTSVVAAPSSTGAKATVNWTNVAFETGYIVERADDELFQTGVVDAPVGTDVRSLSQSGLGLGKTYWYRVRAVNLSGISEWSNAISVSTSPPDAPELRSVDAVRAGTQDQVTVTWTDVANEKTYSLQRAKNDAFTLSATTASGIAAGVTTKTQTLGRNMTFYYRVRAKNAFGYSPWSNIMSILTP